MITSVIHLLQNWPSDGNPDKLDGQQLTVAYAYGAGLIERITQKKQCSACGAARDAFSYYKITPAGRLLVDAVEMVRGELQ